MNFLKLIYLIILSHVVFPNTDFIKPAVFLDQNEKTGEVSFIGFQGNIEGQKTAKAYTLNNKGELIKNNTFSFTLSSEDETGFFTAHYDNFYGDQNKELVLISFNAQQGIKLYVWEEIENKIFRSSGPPHIISKESMQSYPQEAAIIKGEEYKKLAISFGSPNRTITVFSVFPDTILHKNIAEEHLRNQAGMMILKSDQNSNDDYLYILNNGITKTTATITTSNQTPTIETHQFDDLVLDFIVNIEKQKIYLLTNNQLFLSAPKERKLLKGSDKHHKILFIKENEIFILDKNGNIYSYALSEEKQELVPKEIIKSNNDPTHLDYLLVNNKGLLISTHTSNQNQITFHSFDLSIENKEEKSKKEENVYADSLIFTAGETNVININIDTTKQFLNLESIYQPATMSINLNSMQLEWEPTEEETGSHITKYNIEYGIGNRIEEQTKEGKISVESIQEVMTETSEHTIYVNAPPTIKINPSHYKVQADHQLIIPIYIDDLNKEQILALNAEMTPPNKGNIEERNFIWTPKKENHGNNTVVFKVNDGLYTSTATATVFVDSTKNTTTYNEELITTQGEEFVFNLGPEGTIKIIEAPNNLRVSKNNQIHWVSLPTQLGLNTILLEKITQKTTERISMEVFVNAPPIISFRPDNKEVLEFQTNFSFILQSFDANINQTNFWNLETGPEGMSIDQDNKLTWQAQTLDHHIYLVNVTDNIDNDMFYGEIYVNDPPKITSKPSEYVDVQNTFEYIITAEDKNKKSPLNKTTNNKLKYNIIEGPEKMKLSGNTIVWHPQQTDAGTHPIEIEVSDGIDYDKQNFNLYVNDIPKIVSRDSLSIMVGDTLQHLIAAKDENPTTQLTFSISTNIDNMYLNANTGELSWVPTINDIGLQTVEVAVTDGFDSGKSMQTIQIYVHSYPKFLNEPSSEAFVNLEYVFSPRAQNAFGGIIPKEDYIINLVDCSFNNIIFDTTNYVFSTTPKQEELGEQNFTLSLEDLHQNKITKTYNVLVINSPCETTDSLKIEIEAETPEEKKQETPTDKTHKKSTQPRFRIPMGYKTTN